MGMVRRTRAGPIMCEPFVFAIGIGIVLLVMLIYVRLRPQSNQPATPLPTIRATTVSSAYTITDPETLLIGRQEVDDALADKDDRPEDNAGGTGEAAWSVDSNTRC